MYYEMKINDISNVLPISKIKKKRTSHGSFKNILPQDSIDHTNKVDSINDIVIDIHDSSDDIASVEEVSRLANLMLDNLSALQVDLLDNKTCQNTITQLEIFLRFVQNRKFLPQDRAVLKDIETRVKVQIELMKNT